MPYELSLAESAEELGKDLWSRLEGPSDYPFLRYEWLDAFEKSSCLGAPRGWIPRHVVVKKVSPGMVSDTVAVAPAYIKLHSMGEFVFDQGWADFAETRLGVRYYPKMILAVPFTPATGPRILPLVGMGPGERSELYDLLTGALPEIARKLGLSSVHVLFPDAAASAELSERQWALRYGVQFQFHNESFRDFDDFLGRFRSKRRTVIRRECRETERLGVELVVRSGAELRAEDAKLLHRLYLTTVDKYVWGRRYLSQDFFQRILSTMPDAVHFVAARVADSARFQKSGAGGRFETGDVVAGAINLLGTHALYGRYWGAFAEVPFLHFNVCLYRGVQETITRGLVRFEPGAGGEHKESRGFSPTVTRSLHHLEDPRLDAAVRDFLKRERDALLEHFPGATIAP